MGLSAWGGSYFGKLLKLPAPLLVRGMICVAIVQSLVSIFLGYDLLVWWPESIMILSQILIAFSIGSRFQKVCSLGVKNLYDCICKHHWFNFSHVCMCLFCGRSNWYYIVNFCFAFAPGGVVNGNNGCGSSRTLTFVVTVQVLRIVVVILILPPFFRLLNRRKISKQTKSPYPYV